MSLPDWALDPPMDPLYTCFYCGARDLPGDDIVWEPGDRLRTPVQCWRCAKEMGETDEI